MRGLLPSVNRAPRAAFLICQLARQLTRYRGVTPMTTGIGKDVDTTGTLLKQELSTRGLVPSGSVVVFISANARLERADQNSVNLQKFE